MSALRSLILRCSEKCVPPFPSCYGDSSNRSSIGGCFLWLCFTHLTQGKTTQSLLNWLRSAVLEPKTQSFLTQSRSTQSSGLDPEFIETSSNKNEDELPLTGRNFEKNQTHVSRTSGEAGCPERRRDTVQTMKRKVCAFCCSFKFTIS